MKTGCQYCKNKCNPEKVKECLFNKKGEKRQIPKYFK